MACHPISQTGSTCEVHTNECNDCIVHKDNTYTTLKLYKYMKKHTHTTHWHTQMHINMHTYIYTGIHTDTQTHTYTLTHTAYNKKTAYRHSYA